MRQGRELTLAKAPAKSRSEREQVFSQGHGGATAPGFHRQTAH
ncbi:MAG: hypothetical protein PHR18_03290 [Oscillospiraceae bacterium]|nr:hypothetical protein [Oscillospiraceae bacterium]